MKATELLEAQHKVVDGLFERIEAAEDMDEKSDIFEELASNLVAHDAIERTLFYPACEREMGMTDLLGESMVEHGVIEFSLYLADQAREKDDDDFDAKVTVLWEAVEHHVEEEETELFPKVEEALGDEKLEALGAKMEARFEEVREADFRGPLHENLKRVLDGATKGAAAKAPKGEGKKAKGRAHNGASEHGKRARP